jgi:hypothetical protein
MAADAGGGETRNTISGGIFFSAVIQGRDITVKLPPEIIPALSGLPSGTPAFAGRETELHTLLNVLAPRTEKANDGEAPGSSQAPTAVIAAVDGLAGIGKTELAIQAARAALHRGWFPAGVLFVDLFGYDPARSLDPGQALEGFLLALAVPTERIPAEIQGKHSRPPVYWCLGVTTGYRFRGHGCAAGVVSGSWPGLVSGMIPWRDRVAAAGGSA